MGVRDVTSLAPNGATGSRSRLRIATLRADMKQHIAISAIGPDRTGLVHDLTKVISDCGGNISESRMASLGSEFAMVALVGGNWHSLAKLESELARFATESGITLHLQRTEPRAARTEYLPYSIDAVCLDQTGIVSALGRDIGSGPYDNFMQIDAAINPGNSGGPAFNLEGEVVGINTAIFSPSGGSVGIGFAIPASTAQNVIDSLRRTARSPAAGWASRSSR